MQNFFNDITFAYKGVFWLLLIIPLMIAWYTWKMNRYNAELKVSSMRSFITVRSSARARLRHVLFALRVLVVTLLVVILARPQSRSSFKNVTRQGIDITLAIDISASMLAQDFKPNRLEAAKDVAQEFIDKRPNDRIALVIFSGESFTQCPLTTDHSVIKNMFVSIKTGMLADGTAIGMGLANAVNRVKESNAKSKVVILMTDGVNNAGSIAPLTAAEIAKTFGVRVYTIGVGTRGKALSPVAVYPNGMFQYDYVDVQIDDNMLTEIAGMTGGKYFRATDKAKLEQAYREIDQMEKSKIEERNFTEKAERFFPFAIAAGLLLALELILKYTVFRTIP